MNVEKLYMPIFSEFPLVLTSAVRPSAGFTALQDPSVRLEATIFSVKRWIDLGARKIVVCDGSDFMMDDYVDTIRRDNPHVRIECLAFRNDEKTVSDKGKGFGEGQIVAHALSQSVMLRDAKFFSKCTAKIWVENISQVNFGHDLSFAADFVGVWRPAMLDTRFYITSVDFYKRWLVNVHKEVDDGAGYYLEHAFLDAVVRSGTKNWMVTPSLRTVGLSGTAGVFQRRGYTKSFVRDLRNKVLSFIY